MFLQSLVELNNSVSVWNFEILPLIQVQTKKKKRSLPQTGSISPHNSRTLPPNSGEDQNKKIFVTFSFDLSPEFYISCCQVGIT